ncbi:aminotransferase class III-fold pyridoxal phosphate-dependent enzyme [Boseaceae bacterium BT-24-1]|nr:aminotransferase class III-fold pyridoxal phosphate-dependent enzyme [Boseaceae bacterium BT-24-1]
MNAFCASENFESFIVFRSSQPMGNDAENSSSKRSSFRDSDHPLVGEVRGLGLIAAVELVADKATKQKFDPPGKVGLYLFERAQEHGLIVRAIQDQIAFCPPMIITEAQVDTLIERFARALEETQAWIAAGMLVV